MKKMISLVILTMAMTASASINMKMKQGVRYRGGDKNNNMCVIELVSSGNNEIIVNATTNKRIATTDFYLKPNGVNSFIGISTDESNNIILYLTMREDGTPQSYILTGPGFFTSSKTIFACNGLLDAPY